VETKTTTNGKGFAENFGAGGLDNIIVPVLIALAL